MSHLQSVYDAVRLCGHRWNLEILTALRGRPMRFTDLLHAIHPGPSSKSLNEALRRLQEHGLVHHTDATDGSSRYALTEAGENLLPVLLSFMDDLERWMSAYRDASGQPTAKDARRP